MFKCPLYFEKDNFLSPNKCLFPRMMTIKKKNCFIASLKMKTCKFNNSIKGRSKALIFDPLYPYKNFLTRFNYCDLREVTFRQNMFLPFRGNRTKTLTN